MPRLNGTGPEKKGPKTGRGLGFCKGNLTKEDIARLGKGLGKRRKTTGGTGKGKRFQSGLIK